MKQFLRIFLIIIANSVVVLEDCMIFNYQSFLHLPVIAFFVVTWLFIAHLTSIQGIFITIRVESSSLDYGSGSD